MVALRRYLWVFGGVGLQARWAMVGVEVRVVNEREALGRCRLGQLRRPREALVQTLLRKECGGLVTLQRAPCP